MINTRSIFLFVFIVSLCCSCKKETATPQSPTSKNFTLVDAKLDGRAFSYKYSNSSVTPTIVISFSEPIDHGSAQSNITLSGGTGSLAVAYSFSNNDSLVTIQPSSQLKYLSSYSLTISAQLTSTTKKQYGASSTISIITTYDATDKFPRIADDALLDLVEQQTLKYFWDFGHPSSGMARERNTSGDVVTTGGSGFGLMAIIAGMDRGFIPHGDGITRFNKIVGYLEKADRFHGAWPHWIDGNTGKVIPFSTNDNGADLVETSYMVQGLITLREYLKKTPSDTVGNNMINRINTLWKAVEWDWFRQNSQNVLYWHWSPDKAWIMNLPIHGYDEALIVYLLAASSPSHTIPAEVYTQGWAVNGTIKNGKAFYGHTLPLGQDYGGPLFFSQYSFLGFSPHVKDAYADYWVQNVNHSLINHDYCVANPKTYAGYGVSCWGLTASDNQAGYDAQSPTNDNGTITPTAALSSMPYTPTESMSALKFFYYTLGDKLWGTYGFYDAFSIDNGWVATSTLAIDQGPIVIMIENYRSQLLWNLFMSAPEVSTGMNKLGFSN